MGGGNQPLDLEEWDQVLGKMHRLHDNIQNEVAHIIQTIRKEMKQDLVPQAEDKANYGKVIEYGHQYWITLQLTPRYCSQSHLTFL